MATSVALVSANHNNVKCNDSGINISLQMDSNAPVSESQSLIQINASFSEPSNLNVVSFFLIFLFKFTKLLFRLFVLTLSIIDNLLVIIISLCRWLLRPRSEDFPPPSAAGGNPRPHSRRTLSRSLVYCPVLST